MNNVAIHFQYICFKRKRKTLIFKTVNMWQ